MRLIQVFVAKRLGVDVVFTPVTITITITTTPPKKGTCRIFKSKFRFQALFWQEMPVPDVAYSQVCDIKMESKNNILNFTKISLIRYNAIYTKSVNKSHFLWSKWKNQNRSTWIVSGNEHERQWVGMNLLVAQSCLHEVLNIVCCCIYFRFSTRNEVHTHTDTLVGQPPYQVTWGWEEVMSVGV